MKSKLISTVLPYYKLMRLDKPIGIELVFWPVAWALWLASAGMPDLKLLLIFIFGAIVMRSAGCIINDLADRKFDGAVQRTSSRPLVSGAASPKIAFILFIILSLIGLCLVLQLNFLCLEIALATMLLIIIYPFCKRWVMWPQFILGLVFNSGVLIAYAAVQNKLPMQAWLLFASCWLWTVAYDTYYALSDREDDLKIGIKSTAVWFGGNALIIIAILQLLMLFGLVFLGVLYSLGFPYYFSLLCSIALFIYQHRLAKGGNAINCFKAFLNNHWVGVVIFIGLLFSY